MGDSNDWCDTFYYFQQRQLHILACTFRPQPHRIFNLEDPIITLLANQRLNEIKKWSQCYIQVYLMTL